MKKALAWGSLAVVVLGLGVYGQVVGWFDVRSFFNPPAEEEKAYGQVGNLRVLVLKSNDTNEIKDHISIFTLTSNDGMVINLGIDYDNFAFKDGDYIEVVFVKRIERGEGTTLVNNSDARDPSYYKARWYRLKTYRLLKQPTNLPAEK